MKQLLQPLLVRPASCASRIDVRQIPYHRLQRDKIKVYHRLGESRPRSFEQFVVPQFLLLLGTVPQACISRYSQDHLPCQLATADDHRVLVEYSM